MDEPSDDPYALVENYLRAERNRPLGEARFASSMLIQDASSGLHEAASNLLVKAEGALISGDEAKASRLLRRALALPHDEHEGHHPASFQAFMTLYRAVVNALEECEDEYDVDWLEAGLTVASRALRERMVGDRPIGEAEAAIIASRICTTIAEIEIDHVLGWPAETLLKQAASWLPAPAEHQFDIEPEYEPELWLRAVALATTAYDAEFLRRLQAAADAES